MAGVQREAYKARACSSVTVIKYSREYMRLLTDKLVKQGIVTTCLNCSNFKADSETCVLCHLRPPAKVIATGCPQWDPLPF